MRTTSIVFLVLAACAPDASTAGTVEELTYCPGGVTLEGIDVSEWQGSIDWGAVAGSGKAFAIARVSDGNHHVDPYFDSNYAGIRAAGMVRGSYQFFRPLQDPVAQADLVLAHIGTLGPNDLPPMIDIEGTPGDALPSPAAFNAAIHAWVDRIQSVTGRMPLIYVGSYFWDEHIATGDFGGYPLVMPAYGPVCPRIMSTWDHWVMHQYSSTGSVPGISGNVDIDVFDGDRAALSRLAGAPACAAHCEGSVIVGGDCGRGDCAVYGSRCVDDALGARCAFYACPDVGDADVCLDGAHITHCHDGSATAPGDCSVYGSRCVSDALGGRCAFYACPDRGTVDVCLDTGHIAHCHDGAVDPPGDCGAYGAYCSTAGVSSAHCVSAFCVSTPGEIPTEHPACLPDGHLIHCHADATIDTVTCAHGESCLVGPSGAHCGVPGETPPPAHDAGVIAPTPTHDAGMPTPGDAGAMHPRIPPHVMTGCDVGAGGSSGSSGAAVPLLLSLFALVTRGRRR